MPPIRRIYKDEYPLLLRQLDKVKPHMDIMGELPSSDHRFLCVIGSRTHSKYGTEVCKDIIAGLSGYPIVIVSGLAIGIDSLAHEAALSNGLKTIAIPGSGLDRSVIYPSSHLDLADRIVRSGGALLSPFETNQRADYWTFPVRNELMAGISHAVLIIEAREDSGTMITADAAGDTNRNVLAVPGSIFSDLSSGPMKLIREGATLVTCAEHVLEALGFEVPGIDFGDDVKNSNNKMVWKNWREASRKKWAQNQVLSDVERKIVGCLGNPRVRDDLIRKLDISVPELSSSLVSLELRGLISDQDGYITWISTK